MVLCRRWPRSLRKDNVSAPNTPRDSHANCWFIDDGCVVGSPGLLAAVIKLIQSDGPSLGLHINLEKSEVVYLNKKVESDDFFPEQISKHDNSDFEILGVPVGSAIHTSAFLQHKVEKAIRLMEMLEQLDDPQVAYTLLRTCVSFGKFCYYIRTIPPSLVKEAALSFDNCVRSCFQSIISSNLSDSQWMQCTLDLKHGGLGLRKVSEHTNAAYIASVIANSSTIKDSICRNAPSGECAHLRKAVEDYNLTVGLSDGLCTPFPVVVTQKKLSSTIDDMNYKTLFQSTPLPVDRARLTAVSAPHASAWLSVIPNEQLGLSLSPHEWRAVARWWLGAEVFSEDSKCPFCHHDQGRSGHHATVCKVNGDLTRRHNAIRDTIFRMASQAALSPHLEKPYILPGIKQKLADLYIPNWSRGEPLAMDITVVSPTQVHLLDYHHPQSEQLCAAHWREEQKRKKYEQSLDAEHILFVPLAVESFGGWGTASIPIFRTLARMVANRSDQPVSSVSCWLYQRLAIALQKNNARAMIARQPLV